MLYALRNTGPLKGRGAITRAIAVHVTFKDVEKSFTLLGEYTVAEAEQRFKENHLPPHLKDAKLDFHLNSGVPCEDKSVMITDKLYISVEGHYQLDSPLEHSLTPQSAGPAA